MQLVREIIESLVEVGYVAVFVDKERNRLGVVPCTIYAALKEREYIAVTAERWPREHKVRRENRRLCQTHFPYFFDSDEAEAYFHPKFGYPIVFMGDWIPDHGVPTTPCHFAAVSLSTRENLINATRVSAARSMQPATGYVMTTPVGGIGSILNSINSVTGAVGANDVLRVFDEQSKRTHEERQSLLEKSADRLLSYSMDKTTVDQISAVIEQGGDGHMTWVPQAPITALDVNNQLDALVSEIASAYGIPPRRLNLRVVQMKSAHTSLGEAGDAFVTVSAMLSHVKSILDLTREIMTAILGADADFPEGNLKQSVPIEMLMELEPVLSHEGRVELYADTLRVDRSLISAQGIEEIKGQMQIQAAEVRASTVGEPSAKRQRTS